jgi:hypothetical protein
VVAGCFGPPAHGGLPAPQPARRGQILESVLAKDSPGEGKIFVQYLGAIRYPDHARFTWRVIGRQGWTQAKDAKLSRHGNGPRVFDLQVIFTRNSKGVAYMERRIESVSVQNAEGELASLGEVRGSAWTKLPGVGANIALDSLGKLEPEKTRTLELPATLKVMTLELDVPGMTGRDVAFEIAS